MRKLIAPNLLLVLLVAAHALCWSEEKATPLQIVVTEATLTPTGVLRCQWRIRNVGKEVVHVYATFLHGSADDMLDLAPGRTALVRTTWLREIKAYPAYYFPQPEFLDVAPGAEITGSFERRSQPKQRIDQLETLRFVVGYGADVERLKGNIQQSLAKGTEFQVNAVVRWQSLAYSDRAAVVRRADTPTMH
jgi:hypothetical protein